MQKEINSLKKSLSEKGKREGVNQQLSLLKAKVADLQKGAELTPEERLALSDIAALSGYGRWNRRFTEAHYFW